MTVVDAQNIPEKRPGRDEAFPGMRDQRLPPQLQRVKGKEAPECGPLLPSDLLVASPREMQIPCTWSNNRALADPNNYPDPGSGGRQAGGGKLGAKRLRLRWK
jgi:hypothetical protein